MRPARKEELFLSSDRWELFDPDIGRHPSLSQQVFSDQSISTSGFNSDVSGLLNTSDQAIQSTSFGSGKSAKCDGLPRASKHFTVENKAQEGPSQADIDEHIFSQFSMFGERKLAKESPDLIVLLCHHVLN